MTEVRLVKLVSGDLVIGLDDKENKGLKEVANVQIMPTGTGSISIALVPMGFPFDEEISGFIKNEHVLFEVKRVPEELVNKYTEAKSNIKIAKSVPNDGQIIL